MKMFSVGGRFGGARAFAAIHAAHHAIANADNGFNAAAARAEVLPQTPDVDVERARVAVMSVAPHGVEQVLARSDAARAHRQSGARS